MTWIYHPHTGAAAPDPLRCRAGVRSPGMGFFSHQCRRPAIAFVVNEDDGRQYGYCLQHDPRRVKRTRAERDAKFKALADKKTAAWRRAQQLDRANKHARLVLNEIALGNPLDPKALALEALKRYPKEEPDDQT